MKINTEFMRECLLALDLWTRAYRLRIVGDHPGNTMLHVTPVGNDSAMVPVTDDFDEVLYLIGIHNEDITRLKQCGTENSRQSRDIMFSILTSSPLFELTYVRWSSFKTPSVNKMKRLYEDWLRHRYHYPHQQGVRTAPLDVIQELHEVIYTKYPSCRSLAERLESQMAIWKKVSSYVDCSERLDSSIQSLWNLFIQLYGLITLSELPKEEVQKRWNDFLKDHEGFVGWVHETGENLVKASPIQRALSDADWQVISTLQVGSGRYRSTRFFVL
jgi:hypothetical protein